MNQLITSNQQLTMSSREIAQLTEKEHKTVMRDIRVMLNDLGHGTNLYLGQYSANNRTYDEYNLPKRETLLLVSGYMLHVRVKIVDRLEYLESKASQPVSLPSTKQLALMVIQAEEEKEQALLLVEQKTQHIESLESLFHNGGTITQFVKQLNGVNSQRVNAWLNENTKWLYDENKGKVYTQGPKQGQPKPYAWRCASYARDKYATEAPVGINKQGMNPFTKYEVRLLADGKKWLFDKYIKGQLPMKTDWNDEFTHKKDLV